MIKCVVPISGGKDSQACLKLALQELAEAKESIKSVIQHYEDGAVYFERNYEAFYTDSFQDLMVDIYKKHDEAAKESSK